MNVCDMHCDTIMRLYNQPGIPKESLFSNQGHIDIKRMQKSNYLLQTFAIFISKKEYFDLLKACLWGIDF